MERVKVLDHVYETIVILVSHNENKTYIFQNALIHLRPHPCSPENLNKRTVYFPLSPYTFPENGCNQGRVMKLYSLLIYLVVPGIELSDFKNLSLFVNIRKMST